MTIKAEARRDRRAARARRNRPTYPERSPHPTLDRVTRRVARSRVRLRGRNPLLLATSVVRRFSEVRATGLAAEMAYFLVLSLLPLVTAIGAGLGLLGAVLPAEKLEAMRDGATTVVELVLGRRLAGQVVVPLLDDLLAQRSQVFVAVAGAVVALLLSLVVVGPLFGGGEAIADLVGAGALVSWAWSLGRWPVAVAIAWGFLVLLYRIGQREPGWRQVMLGAALATVALLLLTSGFRLYLAVAPPGGSQLRGLEDAASAVGLLVVASLAVLLYAWLSSLIVLGGGIVNVEWAAAGRGQAPPGRDVGPVRP